MSKKNKAKLNKEDELEKNNSDTINSENENLEQNSTAANDTDADNEMKNYDCLQIWKICANVLIEIGWILSDMEI